MSERLLLKVAEAAEVLGIGRSTAYELIAEGRLETVHIGRCCRVPGRR
jgi:excisionase family DNA binding protein